MIWITIDLVDFPTFNWKETRSRSMKYSVRKFNVTLIWLSLNRLNNALWCSYIMNGLRFEPSFRILGKRNAMASRPQIWLIHLEVHLICRSDTLSFIHYFTFYSTHNFQLPDSPTDLTYACIGNGVKSSVSRYKVTLYCKQLQ